MVYATGAMLTLSHLLRHFLKHCTSGYFLANRQTKNSKTLTTVLYAQKHLNTSRVVTIMVAMFLTAWLGLLFVGLYLFKQYR